MKRRVREDPGLRVYIDVAVKEGAVKCPYGFLRRFLGNCTFHFEAGDCAKCPPGERVQKLRAEQMKKNGEGKLMDTPFTNGYKYYCSILLEFVDSCSSCRCSPDDKPLVETQEALVSHLLARGRDPALAWFALSGKAPLPGSDCAASPDQIKSVMAYTQAGKQPEPEYVAGKTDLPLSLVLNVFRFFGIPHKAPDNKRAAMGGSDRPAARRTR